MAAEVSDIEISRALQGLWRDAAASTWNRNRAAVGSWLSWCRTTKRWPGPALSSDCERRPEHADHTSDLAKRAIDRQLSLHILQAALVYVNTLMIQDILAEPEWAGVLTPEDLRGLTPLFWAHVLPYGEVKLNMTRRLALTAVQTVETNAESG